MVVGYTLTPSHCQKAIKKLNNIIITQLITNNWMNILSYTWRFNITTDWKVSREEFETWPIDLIFDVTLRALGIHVTNLGYLEDKTPRITKFPNSNTVGLDLGLGFNLATAIPNNNNQPQPNLSDLETEWAKKKVEKVRRRQQRKITLAWTTSFTDIWAPLTTVVSSSSSAISGGSLLSALASDVFASISALLIASGILLSPAGGNGSASAIFNISLLSHITSSICSAFAISSSGFLFPIANAVGSVFAISGGSFFSSITDNVPFTPATGVTSMPVGSSALSLSDTLSRVHFPFLATLTAPLVGSVMPITRKRSFDKAFMKQRPLSSTNNRENMIKALSSAHAVCLLR